MVLNLSFNHNSVLQIFKSILKAVASPFSGSYWFITAYIFLYLVSPFLDICIKPLSENSKIYKRFLVILTLIIPIYGTINNSNVTCSDFLIAIYWYILYGYLKENPNNFFERNAKKNLVVICLFVIGLEIFFSYICSMLKIETRGIENLIGKFSFFQIIGAISLFYIFKNFKFEYNKFVNICAKGVLGVYLIHQNEFFRNDLWNKIVKLNYFYQNSTPFIFLTMFLLSSIIIFVLCIILDLIRQYLIEYPLYSHIRFLDKFFEKINKWLFVKKY